MTATDGGGDVFLGFLLVVLLIALYFLPAIISASRGKHSNRSAILALNLLLGWTLIGWVVALVWALAQPPAATAKAGGDTSSEPAAMPTEARQPCPFCAEPILPAASVCHYCRSTLPSGWAGAADIRV
jgi:hypothetical protein